MEVIKYLEGKGIYVSKLVKGTTKKAEELRHNYYGACGECLDDIFGSYSLYKLQAYNENVEIMQKLEGHRMRVFNPCNTSFTQAFSFTYEGKQYIFYATKTYNYVVED